jgi:flagellar biosynthesis/type III secretory pathway chaperone
MLQYVTKHLDSRPFQKFPFEKSSHEWSYIATHCQEVKPMNLSRKNLIRGPDWTKTQWANVRKNLHQMFLQYNHSGQHDADLDE